MKRKSEKERKERQEEVLLTMPKLDQLWANPIKKHPISPNTLHLVEESVKPSKSDDSGSSVSVEGHMVEMTATVTAAPPSAHAQNERDSEETQQARFEEIFISLSDDPAEWPDVVTDKQRYEFVQREAPNQKEMDYPYNDSKRRFSSVHFYRVMQNGERVRRMWLYYSTSTDTIFCVCCKLFSTGDVPLRRGTKTWESLSKN